MDFPTSETDRMLSALLIDGVIDAVDCSNARVRVRSGDWVSAWLPWYSLAAGEVRHWRPPSVGEQATVLSPSGLPEQGKVLPGLYTESHDQPNTDEKTVLWEAPAGFTFIIRVGATELKLTNEGVTLTAPNVLLDTPQTAITGALSQGAGGGGDATFGGKVTAQGDVIGEGVSLAGHTHTENDAGGQTNPPT